MQSSHNTHIRDIIISGGGPAGMMAALALFEQGHKVTLIGPATDPNDRRTTALMMPAIDFLRSLHIWDSIEPQAAALKSMRIIDGTSRLIRSPTVTFHASEIDEPAFGYNIPNAVLNEKLSDAVAQIDHIERVYDMAETYSPQAEMVEITTSSGDIFKSRLLVAGDGRNSKARDAAGIKTKRWSYPQTAVVFCFSHQKEHNHTSTEFHTEDGPFTQVPLQGNRSSLVWVTKPSLAKKLLTLDKETLARLVCEKMQYMLGEITIDTEPQAWPLSGLVPHHFAAKRTILIGETAHVFPPIGAQGLNLGTRDVETLIRAIEYDRFDPGSPKVIKAYDRSRRPDILARTGSVDALNRTLLSSMLPAQIVRNFGLEILRRVPPLRAFFVREGLRPGSGFAKCLPSLPWNNASKQNTAQSDSPTH